MTTAPQTAESFRRGIDIAPSPGWVRRVGILLAAVFLAAVLLLALAPWQQTVSGEGSVVAFNPVDREQSVEAPISGRAQVWFVQEGQIVEDGQPLVELADIDPDRVRRLDDQLAATRRELNGYQSAAAQYEFSVANTRLAGVASVAAAESKVAQERDNVRVAAATLNTARAQLVADELQVNRIRSLFDKSEAVSEREMELANAKYDISKAKVAETESKLAAAQNKVAQAERDLEMKQAEAEAKNNSAQATLDDAHTKVAGSESKVLELESKVARQRAQLITAPRAGIIHRVDGGQGGEIVKAGDRLMTIVPTTTDRAVEIMLDGRDQPLLTEGDEVRLQFEGWPAVQFAGQPQLQHGTYAGVVSFVDPTDDGAGSFRTIIQHKPGEVAWPEPDRLRQGVRAKAWVLLDEVPIWFEVWRQINGFPLIPNEKTKDPTGSARKRLAK
ncbi:MAG: HlyD family efflux transporter periplasmic adaptor subunit [Planctomycetota bacterium]